MQRQKQQNRNGRGRSRWSCDRALTLSQDGGVGSQVDLLVILLSASGSACGSSGSYGGGCYRT